ncbi:MAG: hypothetical protein N2109_03395 [Fimbriimonadales bacterium]|nr:hypothetical protein [Fimbriimonadales bacterium]
MKRTMLFLVAAAAVAAPMAGCGGPATGEVDKDYLVKAEELGKKRREIFVRANGDYEAMSPEDRKAYLDSFDGNEENAKRFWNLMKNPPRSFGPEIPGQRQ